jgi:hypothetical protein
MPRLLRVLAPATLSLLVVGCSDDGDDPLATPPAITPRSYSSTPTLVKGLPPGVQAYTLISSDDSLPGSPRFGGSADGAGIVRNADGTFTVLTNHEDNFAVSRLRLGADFAPQRLDYVLSSTAGRWRLCSATMATPDVHGFGPLFLTVGESGIESQIHGIAPNGSPFSGPDDASLLPALGRWNSENAVPLPSTAYPGRTAILIGDDDSGANGGQIAMYLADAVGDLRNGRLYVLARTDNNTRERDMVVGQSYPVEFRQVPNTPSTTGAQIETAGLAANMLQFGRVEDLDWRKGGANAGRELYINVTGQNNTGTNADYRRTKYGRVYRLIMEAGNPLRGTLSVVLDGDDRTGPARQFQNPDNIYVGTNYMYIQEDPNGYGDETHDSYIYQYDLRSNQLQVVMELDHRRTATDATKWNVGTGLSRNGSWEYGAMVDVSNETGIRDAFLIALQPHTWLDDRFLRVAGPHPVLPNERQGSSLILVTGLPR